MKNTASPVAPTTRMLSPQPQSAMSCSHEIKNPANPPKTPEPTKYSALFLARTLTLQIGQAKLYGLKSRNANLYRNALWHLGQIGPSVFMSYDSDSTPAVRIIKCCSNPAPLTPSSRKFHHPATNCDRRGHFQRWLGAGVCSLPPPGLDTLRLSRRTTVIRRAGQRLDFPLVQLGREPLYRAAPTTWSLERCVVSCPPTRFQLSRWSAADPAGI